VHKFLLLHLFDDRKQKLHKQVTYNSSRLESSATELSVNSVMLLLDKSLKQITKHIHITCSLTFSARGYINFQLPFANKGKIKIITSSDVTHVVVNEWGGGAYIQSFGRKPSSKETTSKTKRRWEIECSTQNILNILIY
jgi:hypothetical protein